MEYFVIYLPELNNLLVRFTRLGDYLKVTPFGVTFIHIHHQLKNWGKHTPI